MKEFRAAFHIGTLTSQHHIELSTASKQSTWSPQQTLILLLASHLLHLLDPHTTASEDAEPSAGSSAPSAVSSAQRAPSTWPSATRSSRLIR